jgi:hypothetical protein
MTAYIDHLKMREIGEPGRERFDFSTVDDQGPQALQLADLVRNFCETAL